MAANYPSSLATTATLPAAGGVGANLSTFPHSALHGNINDEMIAVQTELGTAPSGSFSTVKARLDTIGPVGAVLSTWVPSLLQPGPTTGLTIHYARYQRIGRWVQGNCRVECGGAGTISTLVTVGGMYAAATNNLVVGAFEFNDTSTANGKLVGAVYLETTVTFSFRTTTNATENRLGLASFTAALAAGDDLIFNFGYETASD